MQIAKEDLYAVLHVDISLSSRREIEEADQYIAIAKQLDNGEKDTLKAACKIGPLFDGDIPSKQARDSLVEKGLMAKVVVKGEQGYNAATYKGAWIFKLLEAGA